MPVKVMSGLMIFQLSFKSHKHLTVRTFQVCGNNECVKILSSWLQNWGEKILQQKRASKNKDEAESSSSDDDSDFEDSPSEIDDDDDLQNCLLVTGPVGVSSLRVFL